MEQAISVLREQVVKIIELLRGTEETQIQAMSLLEVLLESTEASIAKLGFVELFAQLNISNRSFRWMYELDDDGYMYQEYTLDTERFWTLLDVMFSLYPDRVMALPRRLNLGDVDGFPAFLFEPHSVQHLVCGECLLEGFTKLYGIQCITADSFYGEWEVETIRANGTGTLSLRTKNEILRYEEIEGRRQLAVLKGELAQNSIGRTLDKFPFLQSFEFWGIEDIEKELWNLRTPHSILDVGFMVLQLDDNVDNKISERVRSIYVHDVENRYLLNSYDNSCGMLVEDLETETVDLWASILGDTHFPKLQRWETGEGVYNTHIFHAKYLLQCPKLETIHIRTDGIRFEGMVGLNVKHGLNNLIIEYGEDILLLLCDPNMEGTLIERAHTVSMSADSFIQVSRQFENIKRVHLFHADGDMSELLHIEHLQSLMLEQSPFFVKKWLKQYGHNYRPGDIDEIRKPFKRDDSIDAYLNFERANTLSDIQFYALAGESVPLSQSVLAQLRQYHKEQSFPDDFTRWLSDHGVVEMGGYCLWTTVDGTIEFKRYSDVGHNYLNLFQRDPQRSSRKLSKTFRCSRAMYGQPNGVETFLPLVVRKVLYDDARVPFSEIIQIDKLSELHIQCMTGVSELSTLKSLNTLWAVYLTDLQLTELPIDIGELSHIEELYLWGNELTTLPNSMSKMSKLWKINISKNQFTDLPEVLLGLPNLREICFRGYEPDIEALRLRNTQFANRLEAGEVVIWNGKPKTLEQV